MQLTCKTFLAIRLGSKTIKYIWRIKIFYHGCVFAHQKDKDLQRGLKASKYYSSEAKLLHTKSL